MGRFRFKQALPRVGLEPRQEESVTQHSAAPQRRAAMQGPLRCRAEQQADGYGFGGRAWPSRRVLSNGEARPRRTPPFTLEPAQALYPLSPVLFMHVPSKKHSQSSKLADIYCSFLLCSMNKKRLHAKLPWGRALFYVPLSQFKQCLCHLEEYLSSDNGCQRMLDQLVEALR